MEGGALPAGDGLGISARVEQQLNGFRVSSAHSRVERRPALHSNCGRCISWCSPQALDLCVRPLGGYRAVSVIWTTSGSIAWQRTTEHLSVCDSLHISRKVAEGVGLTSSSAVLT